MKLSSLPDNVLDRLKAWRWDRIIEKHEGPWSWESTLGHGDVEFISIDGRDVLLPLHAEQRPNVTILRTIVSEDQQTLTIFLKDITYADPKYELFTAGFVAVCDKFPDQDFYVAILYHEWFIVEN
ncbi:MAG: hypothetical protein ACRDJE_12900 [Dehalococcoidia bacterium]